MITIDGWTIYGIYNCTNWSTAELQSYDSWVGRGGCQHPARAVIPKLQSTSPAFEDDHLSYNSGRGLQSTVRHRPPIPSARSFVAETDIP
jgi:hypothetical protein